MRRYTYPLTENEKKLPVYICSVGEKISQEHVGPAPDFQCYYHLLYTYKGCGYVRLSDYEGELPEGTGFLLAPYEPREYWPISDENWHTKWLTFGGDFVQPLLNLIPGKQNGKFDITDKSLINSKTNALIESALLTEWLETSSTLLYDMLLNLRHCISFEPNDSTYTKYKEWLKPLIEHMNRNVTEVFDLSKAAEIVGCSPVHLCKIFKKVYNMRPNEYITSLRIKQAQKLLSSKLNLTVAEIGRMSGYEDASYFSKKFRLYIGMTPAEFRENYVSLTAYGIKESDIPPNVIDAMKNNTLMQSCDE